MMRQSGETMAEHPAPTTLNYWLTGLFVSITMIQLWNGEYRRAVSQGLLALAMGIVAVTGRRDRLISAIVGALVLASIANSAYGWLT
jgi:hypothetical protein